MRITMSRQFIGVFYGVLTAALLLILVNTAQAQTVPPRVAVFSEDGFPYYGASLLVTPEIIAQDLRTAGLTVDLLDTDALARPGRLEAEHYAAVILPYGNTFPQAAFPALKRFHQAGGSLVTTGIPFTHPAIRGSAKGWSATPVWSASVRLVSDSGKRAFRIRGSEDQWAGVASSRFPVSAGAEVTVSAAVREDTAEAIGKKRAVPDEGQDNLFIRFYNKDGTYLEQTGTLLTAATATWQTFRAHAATPAGAVAADLSVQLRRNNAPLFVGDFAAAVAGKPVTLANADLKQIGGEFIDLGHMDDAALWGSEGIGVGGFKELDGSEPATILTLSPGDPLHLSGVLSAQPRWGAPQGLDTMTLPTGVQVVPAIGSASRPIVALLVHHSDAFKGAVDAWTYRGPLGESEEYETRQIIARATVAALAKRDLLSIEQQATVLAKLGALPRPTIYANLTLPTPARRYTTFQPKMPLPARHLYVADIRRMNLGEKLLLTSLQGIVNRRQPRIYFLFDDDDKLWLDELQKQKETDAPIPVSDPWSLLETFRDEYKGVVLCDPKVYSSPCIAVSLAGADDLLVALTPPLAAHVKAPVTVDLRGKFKDNAHALRYLRTDILPRLDPFLTICLSPAIYDRGSLDQIIAARGSAFWITGPKSQKLPGANQAGEMEEIKKLFAQMPLGAVVRGFWWQGDGVGLQEDAGVALGSRFGKVTLVSDLITNLSVHSGVPATQFVQKPRPPAPALDPKKVYLAFTMSDGDNLCTWRGYFRRYFDDPVRGTFPIGWGMGPALLDLAPDWARWYYEKATPNDEFICDVSGVAYMYPSSWGAALKDREGAFKYFYNQTQDYMRRMDMKTIRLMDVTAEDIAHVGPLLPKIDFLLPDYGRQTGPNYSDFTYTLATGQPTFRAITNGKGPQNLAEQIRSYTAKNRPAFVNAFIWNWGSSLSDLKKTLDLLGPEYVAVTPSQLNTLYRESQKRGVAFNIKTMPNP